MTLAGGLSGLSLHDAKRRPDLESASFDTPMEFETQELDLSVTPSNENQDPAEEVAEAPRLPTPPRGLTLPSFENGGADAGATESSNTEQSSQDERPTVRLKKGSGRLPPPPSGLEIPVPVAQREFKGAEEEHTHDGTTPNHEPFPGLAEEAIPMVNLDELTRANVSLTATEMFLISRIDGTTTMGDIEDISGDASPLRLQSLMMRLWRSGIITFKD